MTPAEDAHLSAVAATRPGFATYPGITLPGNPRKIVLPRPERVAERPTHPVTEITPARPIPAHLGPQVRPRSAMSVMLDDLREEVAPVIAVLQSPPESAPDPVPEVAERERWIIRRWLNLIGR